MATSLIKSMGSLSSTSTPLAVTDKSEDYLGDADSDESRRVRSWSTPRLSKYTAACVSGNPTEVNSQFIQQLSLGTFCICIGFCQHLSVLYFILRCSLACSTLDGGRTFISDNRSLGRAAPSLPVAVGGIFVLVEVYRQS